MTPSPTDSLFSPDPQRRQARLRAWLQALWPAPVRVDAKERWRAFVGAGIGLLIAGLLSQWLAGAGGLSPWLVAPIGASAVLVFAVPGSPLAQPWSVVGGNTISALVGTACVLAIPNTAVAGAVAVGLAIALMFRLRCLHPPGGATALFAVLAHASDFQFAAFPVLANSILLVLAGMAYNTLTGRAYPHVQSAPGQSAPQAGARFTSADLDTALAHYNQVLDVSRDDLEALLHDAETIAYERKLGVLRCADVMTRDPLAVEFGTPLAEAWALMRKHGIKALPVTDRAKRIAGIVTVADFMRHADLDRHEGIGERLRGLVRRLGVSHTEQPEVVGQIMTRQVRVASADRYLIELVPVFSQGGHHHIPIIDADKRLVGIITQSDLVGALYSAVQPAA
ncbi:MAG: putative rane protein [Ramlibacter sp.]|nr:putative rane protein [Ramlibacter sp.]